MKKYIALIILLIISVGSNFYCANKLGNTEISLQERTDVCNAVFSIIQNPYEAGRQEVMLNLLTQLRDTNEVRLKIGTTTDAENKTVGRFIILKPSN